MDATGPTVSGLVLRALARHRDRVAFRSGAREFSYAAAASLIGQMQAAFVAAGAQRGRGVALLGGNRPEIWCAGVAAQACGMRISWLHPLGSLSAQREQIDDFAPDFLLVDPIRFKARGGQLALEGAWRGRCLTLGPAGYGADLLAQADAQGAVSARDLAHPSDIATINYTGGTTGKSKGAFRRHPSMCASTITVLAEFDLPSTPRYLAVGPISHVTGTKILPTLLRGGTVSLMDGFDPSEFCGRIGREGINVTLLVPTMIYGLLESPDLTRADTASLELLLYGASAMSPARLAEGMAQLGPVFSQLYGQTECYPIAIMPRSDHDPEQPGRLAACGFPVASSEVRLFDDDGQPVPQGEAGEICVRGPSVMEGYWNQPELTAMTLQDGWLRTGDVARQDELGRLFIVDRKKDMIVTGGFNVYPREVEDTLTALPEVSSAAVVGAPHAKWGEAVTAFVVRRAGAGISEQALMTHVKQARGSMSAPKSVIFVDLLPLTALGKVDKKILRDQLWSGHDRKVG